MTGVVSGLIAVVLAQAAVAGPAVEGAVVEGRGAPAVRVPRLEAEVVVDGVLDEPVWERAARLVGFWQYRPVDGVPAEERTEVRVWYSPVAIHFGIVAEDPEPGSIRATRADRDAVDADDHVVIYLDTFGDRRRAYFFAVNPFGIQQDGVRTEGASGPGRAFGGETDRSPDFLWESRGRLTPEGYVVEVRIPFKSLRFPARGPQRWGVNVERVVQRTGRTHTWTDARRATSFLLQAGTLEGLDGIEHGVVLEAQPFLTVTAAGARDAAGAFRRGPADPEAGLNARVGLASLTVDATVNPDFSQVETDEGQVTVNERFALSFPEKRPFFLEGIELFGTPHQLVYTRRIVDPRAGVKVTGKLGGLGVAYLSALDDAAGPAGLMWLARRQAGRGGLPDLPGGGLGDGDGGCRGRPGGRRAAGAPRAAHLSPGAP